jgi:Trk-type K+ transport system membrane component
VSRYKGDYEPINCQFIVILLTVLAGSGFVTHYKAVMGVEVKSKNHDELINFTGVVSGSVNFYEVFTCVVNFLLP